MERVRIAALFADKEQYGGASVTVCGWAKTIRDMKTFGFIELNDGSCFRNLQVVMDANSLSNYKEIAAQNVGAALIVRGTVVLTPEAKQPLEVKATEIEIEGVSSPDYPLQKKRHSVEYLRTIQHLRPRTNLFSAAFRVRSAAAYAVHEFFQSRGFVYVNTPIITGSDCEGAGEMFQVTTLDLENPPRTPDGKVDYSKDFFGKKTSLTVSGQLNAENFAMAFGDVYTFGPTFRAENSNTARHAAEFWMIEPEMAFCDLDGDLEVMEAMVKYIITAVMERCPDDLAFFNSFVDKGLIERLQHVASSDFGRITYTDAVELLKQHNDQFDYKVDWGTDLQTEHERFLTEVLRPLHDGQAVTYRPYDCHTQQLHAPVRAEVRAVSIIEGSYSCHPALWDLYDLHVFLSVGLEEQRRRIAARSGEKMLPMFTNVWIPMEETYFAQFRVAERADLSREHGIGLVNCQTKCNRKQVQNPTSPEQNGN